MQPHFGVSLHRLYLFAVVAAFRLLMDFSYTTYLSPENALENNFTNNYSPEKGYQSWMLMMACAAFLPLTTRKPSDFLMYVFFIFPVMATISFYAFLDGDAIFAYSAALGFITVAVTRNVRFTLPYGEIRNATRWAVPLCFLIVAIIGIAYYMILGMGKFQLSVMEVYSVRLDISEELSQSNLLGYVGTWTWTVVTTFLIAWSLARRQWLLLPILLAVQVYFFGITSAKAVLFFPALVFVTYIFAQPNRSLTWLFKAGFLFVSVGILEEALLGTFLWNQVLVRRVLWDAGRLNWSYYELFSKIGHVYLSENVLQFLIPYPFALDPQHLVGLTVYGRPDANADTGFLGTAYMHFGPAGMIVFSLITGLLMRITDMLTLNRMPVWMGIAIVIGPFYALFNDSDLPTTMLTHGLAPALVLLFLYGHFPQNRVRALTRRRGTQAA